MASHSHSLCQLFYGLDRSTPISRPFLATRSRSRNPPESVDCYIYQTHPHTKDKKAVWLCETTSGQSCSSEFLLIPSILRGSVLGDGIERDGPLVNMLLHVKCLSDLSFCLLVICTFCDHTKFCCASILMEDLQDELQLVTSIP